MDFLHKKGFNCFIKENNIIIGDTDFFIKIDNDSIVMRKESLKLKKALNEYKSEFFAQASKIAFSKAKLNAKDMEYFAYNEFCPFLIECYNNFKVNFSVVASKINSLKNMKAYFQSGFFNVLYNNSSFSVNLSSNNFEGKFEYNNFCADKMNELSIGYPYSLNYSIIKHDMQLFNGNENDLKKIASVVLCTIGESLLQKSTFKKSLNEE
jgi:hypothetical protein